MERNIIEIVETMIEMKEESKKLGYGKNLPLILGAVQEGVDINTILYYVKPFSSPYKANRIIKGIKNDYPKYILDAIRDLDLPDQQIELIMNYPEYRDKLLQKSLPLYVLERAKYLLENYKGNESFIQFAFENLSKYHFSSVYMVDTLYAKFKKDKEEDIRCTLEEQIQRAIRLFRAKLKISGDIGYEYNYKTGKLYLVIPHIGKSKFNNIIEQDLNYIFRDIENFKYLWIRMKEMTYPEVKLEKYEPFKYDQKAKYKAIKDNRDSIVPDRYKMFIEKPTIISDVRFRPSEFEEFTKYYETSPKSKMSSIMDAYKESMSLNDTDEYGFSDFKENHEQDTSCKNDELLSKILKEFGY